MFRSLQAKLTGIFIVTVCITLGALFGVLEKRHYEYRLETLEAHLAQLADAQATGFAHALASNNLIELTAGLEKLQAHSDLAGLAIRSPSGELVTTIGNLTGVSPHPKLLIERPLSISEVDRNTQVGTLVMSYTRDRIVQETTDAIWTDIAIILVTAIVLVGATVLGSRALVMIPLQRLINAIEHQRRSGEHRVVQWKSRDEMGVLINRYNELAAENQEAKAAIERKQALLNTVLDNVSEGICMIDPDRRLVAFNDRCMDLLDLPAGCIDVGIPYEEMLRRIVSTWGYSKTEVDNYIQDRMKLLEARDETSTRRVSRHGRIIEIRRRMLSDGGLVNTIIDMTEHHDVQMALQEEKEKAENMSRAKSEFLALMSHELRTPLNSIIGFSEIIATRMFGDSAIARYTSYAKDINRSGTHLLDVINDILDLSKIEAGEVTLHEEPVELAEVSAFAIGLLRSRASAGKVEMVIKLPEPAPVVMADNRLLRQILINLLSNAVKFTGSGGKVVLRAEYCANGDFQFQVSDTGVGIAAEDLKRVLEPFGQARKGQLTTHEGTGLGLPLAKQLTELHGGSLTLESELGVGTTVTIYLPQERIMSKDTGAPRYPQPEAGAAE